MFRNLVILVLALAVLTAGAAAQDFKKNEVGLLLGWKLTSDPTITAGPGLGAKLDVGGGLTYQANYARHLVGRDKAALWLEFPLVATPSTDIRSSFTAVPRNFASLFLTPSLRVNFAPQQRVSPWLSIGGGYARFSESEFLINGAANPGTTGTNQGALQFGGGVDFNTDLKILVPIGFRAEIRDFYSGKPNYLADTGGGYQHNVVFSGGFLLRF